MGGGQIDGNKLGRKPNMQDEELKWLNKIISSFQDVFKGNPTLGTTLLETFKMYINSQAWPDNYFYLKKVKVPSLIGNDASDFYFSYLEYGKPNNLPAMDNEIIQYMDNSLYMLGEYVNAAILYHENLSSLSYFGVSIEENKNKNPEIQLHFKTYSGQYFNIPISEQIANTLAESLTMIGEKLHAITQGDQNR